MKTCFGMGAVLFLVGCSTTVATLTPAQQQPVCESAASTLVLWDTQWRPDQKDIAEREFAAEKGLQQFFVHSGCFAHTELQRMKLDELGVRQGVGREFDKLVTITVREIGPWLMLFSNEGMIEGGTEVVLNIAEYARPAWALRRQFDVHWFNGGRFVIKGVESLPNDMQEALRVGLMPGGRARDEHHRGNFSLRPPVMENPSRS